MPITRPHGRKGRRAIIIKRTTFERLQQHATPLVDTSESVIARALDALDALKGSGATSQARAAEGGATTDGERGMVFGAPEPLPDVGHTKLLAASIGGSSVKANWNNVLRAMLLRARRHYGDFDQLKRRCAVNIVPREKSDEGYRYLPQAGFSYQGVNANAAANAIVGLAKDIGVALVLDFEWREKEQAAYPGRRATIHVPAASAVPHDGVGTPDVTDTTRGEDRP